MHLDLLTLYLLAIGTLLASAGMMFWEHRGNPARGGTLRTLAAAFAVIAVGCAAALFRRELPGAAGSAISNLVILSGYLLVLEGVASLSGRRHRAASAGLLIAMALVWLAGGTRWQDVIWNYLSAIPIAAVSGMTAWEMLRCPAMKSLPSRYIVAAVTSVHALAYAGRALVLPWLVTDYGGAIQLVASKITMYEGVLYSVLLPMSLLKLMREESHGQLLRESRTDYLTRLGNRRWFFEESARIASGEDGRQPLSILAFDLDHFKAINDLHGHQTGDEVLKSFAEIARGVVGPDVVLARIGGEEFAALLAGRDAPRAQALGEAVARRFAETISDRIAGLGMPATVSIGLARLDAHRGDAGVGGNKAAALAEALAAADRALYRAKSLGGNRLELADAIS
ncbi:GGDEF domain-containing protein [Bordetella genomosp. 8]|uniref:diguanylate cyclase n=1 Tax=Bordetella genomosp. 8 TaxID=1416806 RepID=A0A1W6YGC2_9BORD|nr:GGDEF domain-containing protein [Bordetella genomosp. 8]ARP79583.1 GGDEF domain-containing protein [Bordetella genomosp. 8]